MNANWIMAREGVRVFEIDVYNSAGVIVKNALSMLRDEMEKRHTVKWSVSPRISGRLVIEEPLLKSDDDQSYRLRTELEGGNVNLIVTGSGERGILYGICELLDRAEERQGIVGVPALDVTSSPSMKKRGTERHWLPKFSDEAGVEANIQLIRALARKRINTLLWIDGWIAPGWYRFLEFRHYPPLRRPELEASVAQAKDCLRRIVAEARAWGMEFYLSVTEMTVPERLPVVSPHLFRPGASGFPVLRFELPETWVFFRAKIREIMEDIPGLAGVELWTAEAMDPSICHFDHPEAWPLDKQLLHVYTQTLQAMDEAGRPDARAVCATFIHHPEGERAFEPLCGHLPARCEGRMKMQVEDFYRFHAPSTLAGKISPGREWVEMDPGGEHRGDWIGWINTHLRYIHNRMRHYYDRDVRQFICRVRGFSTGPYAKCVGDLDVLSGVQSIKYDAYFRWCWDIDLSIEEVWRQCKPRGYPNEMLEFYLLSEKVSDQTQNVGHCLVNNNHATFLGSIEHYESKMSLLNVYGNDECRRRVGILEPTVENLEAIIAEKDEAVACAARMREILMACEPHLPSKDYAILHHAMIYQEQCVRVWRYHTEAFFRYRLFHLHKPGGDYESLIRACDNCQAEIRKLRPLDENQADNALALVGNLRSLAWVGVCSRQLTAKGILSDAHAGLSTKHGISHYQ